MKKEFWLERWERAEIGFHQNEINPYLRIYWPELSCSNGSEIFVPLCGKSLDMVWLRQQGCKVLGVELSSIAVQDFFKENALSPIHTVREKFELFEADAIRVLCGDFFDLRKEDMATVSAVYDRASLVALPPDMRERYARHLVDILKPATQILLVTFDYPQAEMQGPPFAVSVNDVEALYGHYADIRLLAQEDVLAQNPRFQQRGMSRMQENIFLLMLRQGTSMDTKNANPEDVTMCHCSGTKRDNIQDLFKQGLDINAISRWIGALSGCGGCEWDIAQLLKDVAEQKSNSLDTPLD